MQRSELARLSNMLFMLCSELALENFQHARWNFQHARGATRCTSSYWNFRHAVDVMPLAPRTSQKGLALSADTADVCWRLGLVSRWPPGPSLFHGLNLKTLPSHCQRCPCPPSLHRAINKTAAYSGHFLPYSLKKIALQGLF